jgi:hypothetical protein
VKRSHAAVVVGVSIGAVGAGAVAVFATIFSAAPPSLVAIVGVGGTLAAARLEPYGIHFVILAFLLSGIACWRAYAPRRTDDEVRTGRVARIVLWFAVVFTLVSALAVRFLR